MDWLAFQIIQLEIAETIVIVESKASLILMMISRLSTIGL